MVTIEGQDYLTTKEAQEALGVGREKFWRLLKVGEDGTAAVKSFRNPYRENQRLVSRSEISAYQERLSKELAARTSGQ